MCVSFAMDLSGVTHKFRPPCRISSISPLFSSLPLLLLLPPSYFFFMSFQFGCECLRLSFSEHLCFFPLPSLLLLLLLLPNFCESLSLHPLLLLSLHLLSGPYPMLNRLDLPPVAQICSIDLLLLFP